MPGPDFLWSVDGYCKLVNYRFKIYAAINVYSQYIVWLYVGISACTSIVTSNRATPRHLTALSQLLSLATLLSSFSLRIRILSDQ